MTADELNARFALPGALTFRTDASGLVFADIDNTQATASLCLQGAHLATWRPKTQAEPVVWLSPVAKYAPGKSIRGGAPVCWPWFGAHKSEAGFPGHGFARTVMWAVIGSAQRPDGASEITLELQATEATRAQWPHATRLTLKATVGESLAMELTTHNLGNSPIEIGEALHTYFQIGDIGEILIGGLDGTTYIDKVDGGARKNQQGAVTCNGEVDRVYLDTATTCVISDTRLKRRIVVEKSGSLATVVWTPWVEKAAKMGDFGEPDGWRRMVCVESANAADNVVSIAPGQNHTLAVVYRAEAL